MLLLAYAATCTDTELPLEAMAAALTRLGWRSGDGTPIVDYDVYRLRGLDVLRNLSNTHLQRDVRSRIGDSRDGRARTCRTARAVARTVGQPGTSAPRGTTASLGVPACDRIRLRASLPSHEVRARLLTS
jgi:hypothetical protein